MENVNNEKKQETGTVTDSNAGDKPKELDKIERAQLAVKRMEEVEARLNEKIAKLEELEVNRLMGSTAGGRVEVQPKVETPAEYAKRVSEGKI